MTTRTLFLVVLAGLIAITGAFAGDLTVVQGDLLTINADSGVSGMVSSARATFSLPAVNYLRDLTVTSTRDPVFTDTVRMNIEPGVYPLTISITVNGEQVSYEHVDVHVVAKPTTTTPAVPSKPVVQVQAPSRVLEAISVPAMPDLTAGELFVLPVKVRGNGVYVIEIPSLPFGTYEIPNPVTVDGERVVPILIRVDANAQPGTYTIPIYMAGVQTNARVRVLQYTTRPNRMNLILIAGLVLLIIAIILALILGKGPREPRMAQRPRTETRTETDEPVITYY